jgi:hypothetical protein
MEWFRANHVALGMLADSVTFAGGCILTRDALLRLRELRRSRVDQRFKEEFPKLNLTDDEWEAAIAALRWTVAGFGLMVLGFLLQLGLRAVEA